MYSVDPVYIWSDLLSAHAKLLSKGTYLYTQKATIKRGNVIIAGNLAITRTIVGRKAVERQTKSQIG